jgi:signal-transduction protein with cAMP-binding, CBS, and nucleotidyltransferase domain
MAQEPKTATTEMTPMDAARLMSSYDFGMVPIVDADRRLTGIVTDRDIVLRVLASGLDPNGVELGQIATDKNLVTVGPDDSLSTARERMAKHRIKRLPVVKDGALVGVIALGDVAVTSSSPREVGEIVAELFRSPATEEVVGEPAPDVGTPERAQEARSSNGHEAVQRGGG